MLTSQLTRDLKSYNDDLEEWTSAHDQAMACYSLEDVIAKGILIFNAIARADEGWRAQGFTHAAYDAGFDRFLQEAYQTWFTASRHVFERFRGLEQEGYHVERGEEFTSCYRECAGILTPDVEFFADGKLDAIRDAAVDEHRDGHPGEHGPS